MKYRTVTIHEYPLEEILEHNKVSIRKFAALAGIEYTHVYRLIKGTYAATEKTMDKICKAVNVNF